MLSLVYERLREREYEVHTGCLRARHFCHKLTEMVALPVPARITSAMRRFYRDGGQALRALDRDAMAAVLAFQRHPRGIAPLHFLYEWSPLLMEAEQRRISVPLMAFLERLRVSGVTSSHSGTEKL